MSVLAGRSVLLVISGGIAAYKALELVRLLRREGVVVTAVLTEAARQFVTPLSVQALTERPVYADLWSLTDEQAMGHIQLSRAADVVVVAPASADLLARMAAGLADDLATTLLLATDKPVLVAPAMNVRMWQHAATRANMAVLVARGVAVVGPEVGEMACHEVGPGRLAEPPSILAAIAGMLAPADLPLAGRRAVVTSGPTHEPIDPVRYLANRSSGRQGHAIAAALAGLGAEVTLVHGPVALAAPRGVVAIGVETAEQMRERVMAAMPADIFVGAAAVADFQPAAMLPEKWKKQGAALSLGLRPTPDILAEIAEASASRPALVVGFAAETQAVQAQGSEKRRRKKADWLLANHVGAGSDVMGGADNQVLFITEAGAETWPLMPKTEVAARLARRIAAHFAGE